MLNKRTNILFSEELWNNLLSLAKSSNTSAGELIRKAVENTYFNDDRKSRITKANKTILSIRKKGKNIDHKALIDYGRKY